MTSSDGKLFGAFLGGLLGGPWGALVGGAIGALMDDACDPDEEPYASPRPTPTGPLSAAHGRTQYRQRSPPRRPSVLERELSVLGLSVGVTVDQVKRRYHVLARELHPDVLTSRGMDQASIDRAQETFKQVTRAYHLVLELLQR